VSTLDHKRDPDVTTVRRLEVIPGTGRRCQFTEDFKARVVEATVGPSRPLIHRAAIIPAAPAPGSKAGVHWPAQIGHMLDDNSGQLHHAGATSSARIWPAGATGEGQIRGNRPDSYHNYFHDVENSSVPACGS
jgi:hypothetical protein